MKNVYEELYKRITELERYVVDSEKSEKNDIYTLRDVIFESIKNTDFLEKIKNDTDKYLIKVDPFLKEILANRNQSFIKDSLFGKKEQIKITLVSLIDQLAHTEYGSKYKNEAISLGLQKRRNERYTYSNELVLNALDLNREEWYDKKNSSIDVKKLKKIYELSGARENDENIKNKDLIEFNEALNFKEVETILYDIKEKIMVECIKDKNINKAIYSNEKVKNRKGTYLRLIFNTDEEYMLTMAHLNEEKYTSLSRKYRNNIKSIKYIPRSLSTPFPIFLSESEWKKESKYNDLENNYRIRYRNIKNEFEKYDELSKQERRVLYDK